MTRAPARPAHDRRRSHRAAAISRSRRPAAGDPAAFARVQAGSLDAEPALAEGYRRNNSGSYAEAAEFFDTLLQRDRRRPANQRPARRISDQPRAAEIEPRRFRRGRRAVRAGRGAIPTSRSGAAAPAPQLPRAPPAQPARCCRDALAELGAPVGRSRRAACAARPARSTPTAAAEINSGVPLIARLGVTTRRADPGREGRDPRRAGAAAARHRAAAAGRAARGARGARTGARAAGRGARGAGQLDHAAARADAGRAVGVAEAQRRSSPAPRRCCARRARCSRPNIRSRPPRSTRQGAAGRLSRRGAARPTRRWRSTARSSRR